MYSLLIFSVKASRLLFLGLLTAVKLKIIPYKPFIKITYTPTYTTDEAMKVLEHETMKGNKIYQKNLSFCILVHLLEGFQRSMIIVIINLF